MAWTTEVDLGTGWKLYTAASVAGAAATDAVDTRSAHRVIIAIGGAADSGSGAGTGAAQLQFATTPTATAAGSSFLAYPDMAGLSETTSAYLHLDGMEIL